MKPIFKALILVTVFIVFLALSGYFLIQSSFVISNLVKLVVNQSDTFRMEKFSIEDVKFTGGALVLTQVHGSLHHKANKEVFDIDFESLTMYGQDGNESVVRIDNFNLISKNKDLHLNGFDFEGLVSLDDVHNWLTEIRGEEIVFKNDRFTQIKANLDGNKKRVNVNYLIAKFYEGELLSDMVFYLNEEKSYDIKAKLHNIQTQNIEEQRSYLNQIKGNISGRVRLIGDSNRIEVFESDFQGTQKTQIKASLLKPLIGYLPEIEQKKRLETIAKIDGLISCEEFKVNLTSQSSDQLTAKILIKSKEYNLDLNLTFDLNVEGGVQELLKLGHAS